MRKKLILRVVAVLSGLAGFVLIAIVVYPIASYEAESRQKYPYLLNPVADSGFVLGAGNTKGDLTKASNWFPLDPANFNSPSINYFTLSIPKLKIDRATVAIGGEDLSENLIQYPGTAVPGKIGNSVIFGHSVLPIYYNPKNYLAIFSTLPSLEEGDEIIIDYDGITYRYEVESMFEVLPTDLQVLDQSSSDSYISLITCTPPGHPQKPKRLIVRAKVTPFFKLKV